MIAPPADAFALTIAALQCMNLLAFANEKKSPTPYSKFAHDDAKAKIPSRWGMLLIYGPAFAAALYCAATAPQLNGRELLVASLLALHFGKRVAEVLGLHKYSGSVQAAASGFIGFFYALVVLLICSQQHKVPASLYAQRPSFQVHRKWFAHFSGSDFIRPLPRLFLGCIDTYFCDQGFIF